MHEHTYTEKRQIAEDEIIDIVLIQVPVSSEIPHGIRYSFNYRVRTSKGWKDLIRFDNAHIIKGHHKRDHKHIFEHNTQEIKFSSPEEILNELMKIISDNRSHINEIKRS